MTTIEKAKEHFQNILDRANLPGSATGTDAVFCFIEAQQAIDELSALEAEKPEEKMRCPSCRCVVDKTGAGHHSASDCVFMRFVALPPCADALPVAKIISINCASFEDDALEIQKYAESYHAKQCAACMKSAWKDVKERQNKVAELLSCDQPYPEDRK